MNQAQNRQNLDANNSSLRAADQQVNMFGHHNISDNFELITPLHLFKYLLKDTPERALQKSQKPATAERILVHFPDSGNVSTRNSKNK